MRTAVPANSLTGQLGGPFSASAVVLFSWNKAAPKQRRMRDVSGVVAGALGSGCLRTDRLNCQPTNTVVDKKMMSRLLIFVTSRFLVSIMS